MRLLADALQLGGSARVEFEAAARGHTVPGRRRAPGGARRPGHCPATSPRSPGASASSARLAEAAAGAGGVVSIHAIGGMAGIGKTAFAVHAAHQLAGRFPGGQIFLPLHAHTPGQPAGGPGRCAGQPAADHRAIPAGRSRPIWRRGPGCGATGWPDGSCCWSWMTQPPASRSARCCPAAAAAWCWSPADGRLTALEDAQTDQPGRPPARRGSRAAGPAGRPARAQLSRPRVGEITRLCGCLPLAIGMPARQLYHHPAWTAGRAGRRAGRRHGPARAAGHREPVRRRRVRPVLPDLTAGPAAAVPPARAAPRRRHRPVCRRGPGRHRPDRRPPWPGGPV